MTNNFSLVIPCYNEALGLPELLSKCDILLKKHIEVVLVNNGSTDDTFSFLNNLKPNPYLKIIHLEKNLGYGGGILAGLNAASGDVLGWTHADLQTDPSDFLTGIKKFDNKTGSLFVKGLRKGRPFSDYIFTFGMSLFESLLFRRVYWDINAQPTIFHKSFLKSLHNPPSDFSLDLFVYVHAKRRLINIERIPVYFYERKHGQSNWNIDWKSKRKFILRTLSYSLKLYMEIKHASRST